MQTGDLAIDGEHWGPEWKPTKTTSCRSGHARGRSCVPMRTHDKKRSWTGVQNIENIPNCKKNVKRSQSGAGVGVGMLRGAGDFLT